MIEFKIQIEESIVKEYGKSNLEGYLQKYINKAILKLAAKEILKDWDDSDIDDDSIRLKRENIWGENGRYFVNVMANV